MHALLLTFDWRANIVLSIAIVNTQLTLGKDTGYHEDHRQGDILHLIIIIY